MRLSAHRSTWLSRYEGQKHSSQGYLFLFVAATLSTLDLIALGRRLYNYVKAVRAGEEKLALKSCWNTVVLAREDDVRGVGAEYAGLVSDESEEDDATELKIREIDDDVVSEPIHVRRAQFVAPIDVVASPRSSTDGHWANEGAARAPYPQSAVSERTVFDHSPRGSIHSDETLHENVYLGLHLKGHSKYAILKKTGNALFATAERCLVFAGYMQTITGIVIYTGGCRENYINACLAHLISKRNLSFNMIYT